MIPFQQILDTTRTAGEICCPGDKYWFTNTKPAAGICDYLAGGTCGSDAPYSGLNPYAPGMKINPKDGSYHFYTGNVVMYSKQHYNSECAGYAQGIVSINRNGDQNNNVQLYLDTLTDSTTNRCGCRVEGWHNRASYYIDGSKRYVEACTTGCFPCCSQGTLPCVNVTCHCTMRTGLGDRGLGTCVQRSAQLTANWTNITYFEPQANTIEGNLPALSWVMVQCAPDATAATGGGYFCRAIGTTSNCVGSFGWTSGTMLYGDESDPHTLRFGGGLTYCNCCCFRHNHGMWMSSHYQHPEKEYEALTTNCGSTCCITASSWVMTLPSKCRIKGKRGGPDAEVTWTIAKKPLDIASADDGVYLAIVSSQDHCCVCCSSKGLSSLFCLHSDLCASQNSCPKYQRPNGIVWKMDLPSWSTCNDWCWCHSGKLWYMHNDEILGKCSQLTVKDLYFRDNKIVVKPVTYAGAQECFCCFNGATAHPTVVFCECNCDVRYLSFISLSTNTPVVADLIYTTRGTWISATPTHNASWSSSTSTHPTPSKGYGAITLAEWSEDFTTCYGAIDVCNTFTGCSGYQTGGFGALNDGVGMRFFCCDNGAIPDFELGYDQYDDSIILSWSGPGGCCCYTQQQNIGGGIKVIKVPSDMSITCEWVCQRLKVNASNICCATSCAICSLCGSIPTCFWPNSLNSLQDLFMIQCGATHNSPTGFSQSPAISTGLGCGDLHGLPCQNVRINLSNNPLVSVTCTTMACCTLNADCWLNGCRSAWYIASTCVPSTCSEYALCDTSVCFGCYARQYHSYIGTLYCTACRNTPCTQMVWQGGGMCNAGDARTFRNAPINTGCYYELPDKDNTNPQVNQKFNYRKFKLDICDYS